MANISRFLLASLALSSMSGVAFAKADAASSAPPPPPAPPAPPAFEYDFDFDLPVSKAPGRAAQEDSEEAKKIKGLPLPNAEGKFASFLIPVSVGAEITDATERAKQFKALCKTVQNRLGGTVRRIRAAATKVEGSTTKPDFSIRMAGDEKLGYGVRVWRLADSAIETATETAPA
mgnify:CR=1 FL=1